MSKDIRSYFSILSTKSDSNSKKPVTPTKKRSKPALISSDEEIIPETPVPKKEKEKILKKRKVNVLDSDSEEEKSFEPKKYKTREDELKTVLKPVKPSDIFGSEPIKQTKIPDRPKPSDVNVKDKTEIKKKSKGKRSNKKLEHEKFGDLKFEDTLFELDDDFFEELEQLDDCKNYRKELEDVNESQNKIENDKTSKTFSKIEKTEIFEEQKKPNEACTKNGETKNIVMKETSLLSESTPSKNSNLITSYRKDDLSKSLIGDDVDAKSKTKRKTETYDPDEDMDRYEKKRRSAVLYQKYLNRSGPAHHGSKEIPQGKPDCLKNLCFIRTGVLDSIDENEFESIIKNHGGKVVHSVSKKVNYVVAGVDPGPAKIEKAKSYGIEIISEDDLLHLIKVKSGLAINGPDEVHSLDNLIDGLGEDEKAINAAESKIKPPTNNNVSMKDIEQKISKNFYDVKPASMDKSPTARSTTPENGITGSVDSKYFNKEKTKCETKSSSSARPSINLNQQPRREVIEFLPWTEKYKPTNIKSIIGQQGDKSSMNRLKLWLQFWFKNHGGKNKVKLTKPSPWAKNDDGSYFKAALLSGPPGVGKTTTAHLVAKELGFDVVEFNASDTRSKKLLQEELSQLLNTKSLAGFFTGGTAPTSKHVLLMDEVDGMAGNEDRGGIQELIILIKSSSIPIICMCNDRNLPKMRSLTNYCFDLRFSKPRLEQIKGAMMSICFKEDIDITPNVLNEVITAAGMDIRQILTNLSLWSADKKSLTMEATTKNANTATKDVPLGQWEVCHKVFSEADHKKMSITDRARLFYHDYSLGPLFVQENYLKAVPNVPKKEYLKVFSTAADSISMGDLIDKQIRSSNNWSLLDVQAMCASVIPGTCLQGHLGGQIDFPSWLGKNSKKNKFNRLVSEIQAHMRTSISGSRSAVNLDYVTHLRNSIARPLINDGGNGINAAIEVMHSYNLLREDLDGIIELSQWPKQKDPMNMVDSKVKAAFTRAYNKKVVLPYAVNSAGFKKKAGNTKQNDEYDIGNDEDQELDDSSPEDNDDIANDAMIKAKKPSSTSTNKKEAKPKPTSSKQTKSSGSIKGRNKK